MGFQDFVELMNSSLREGVLEINAMPATWTRTYTPQFLLVASHCRIERANQLSHPKLKKSHVQAEILDNQFLWCSCQR